MITQSLRWTEPAAAGLERYLAVRLAPGQLEGADPADLRSDLQAHIEEELSAAGASVVTLEDLRLVLAKMGEELPPAGAPLSGQPLPLVPTSTPAVESQASGEVGGIPASPIPGAAESAPAPAFHDAAPANTPGVVPSMESRAAAAPQPAVSPVPGAIPQRSNTGWSRPAGDSRQPSGLALSRKAAGRFSSGWFFIFAILLPLGTFVFEFLTRGGSDLFFNPMPDLWGHLLVLLVPCAGWAFWRAQRLKASPRLVKIMPFLVGAGMVSAGFYALCFIPVMPLALIGVIWFGLGLLPLAPLFAFLALWRARVRLQQDQEDGRAPRSLVWGGRLTVLAILLWQVPVFLTQAGIDRAEAAGEDDAEWAAATRFIRRFGSQTALLEACYPDARGGALSGGSGKDPAAWIAGWFSLSSGSGSSPWNRDQTTSQELYYRVTGRPFNEVPAPPTPRAWLDPQLTGRGRIDEDRGGTRVAGRIPGLSLAQGRMDWHCGQASGLAWGEWTLTFNNITDEPEEARCRIALPPGGFVSRVTLWVNGEPQEAAYSTVSQVRAAYQAVAVVERRDPVLVTQPDAGSILVQAFPVPAGGQLKTRITFTVPAGPDQKVWLPAITERNFDFPSAHQQPLWIQADAGTLEMLPPFHAHAAVESGAPTLTASLPLSGFTGPGTFFTWRHQPASLVYAQDPFAPAESKTVVRRSLPDLTVKPAAVAWVIDTSAPLKPHRDAILAAVKAHSVPGQTAVFLPGDEAAALQTLTDPDKLDPGFAGGRDNTPALKAAVEWMRGKPGACLIWLHGPQPVSADRRAGLEQLLQRSPVSFHLMDAALEAGENTLTSVFSGNPRIQPLPLRHAGKDLAASLGAAFSQRQGSFSTLPEGTPAPDGAVKTGDSLARWFARTEAERLSLTDHAAASRMASSHQIVSPWSGAVVLERASDYQKHGLDQADAKVAQQIPQIPEPSGVLLLLMSSFAFLLRRNRKS